MTEIATVIPTLNEEIHIARAIDSVRSLGPVFVLDSGSSDRTQAIARSNGAQVQVHPWEGYAAQKNWALDSIPMRSQWILFLDADEYLMEPARQEIMTAVGAPGVDGYYLARRFIFLGAELRHAWWYPDYQLRLFKRNNGRFENRLVHEHVVLAGRPAMLREPIWHENLRGIDHFIGRHITYAGLEAEEIKRQRLVHTQLKEGSFLGTWPERRRALKTRIWYRLPGRSFIRFAWLYFIRRGFLDGRRGLIYSQLIASYDAFIDAKLLEQEVDKVPGTTFARRLAEDRPGRRN